MCSMMYQSFESAANNESLFKQNGLGTHVYACRQSLQCPGRSKNERSYSLSVKKEGKRKIKVWSERKKPKHFCEGQQNKIAVAQEPLCTAWGGEIAIDLGMCKDSIQVSHCLGYNQIESIQFKESG